MLVQEKGDNYTPRDLMAVQRPDELQYGRFLGLADTGRPFTQTDVKKCFRWANLMHPACCSAIILQGRAGPTFVLQVFFFSVWSGRHDCVSKGTHPFLMFTLCLFC